MRLKLFRLIAAILTWLRIKHSFNRRAGAIQAGRTRRAGYTAGDQ